MRSSLSRADPLVRGRRPRRPFRAEMKLRWLDEVRGVLRTAMGPEDHRGRGGWQGAAISHNLRSKERSHERKTIPDGSVSCDGNQRIRARSKPPERRPQPGLAAPLSGVSWKCERCTHVPRGRRVRHNTTGQEAYRT
jgi:hypothetical protein